MPVYKFTFDKDKLSALEGGIVIDAKSKTAAMEQIAVDWFQARALTASEAVKAIYSNNLIKTEECKAEPVEHDNEGNANV